MGEHRVVIEKLGHSLGVWEPGEAGGIHERVVFLRDEFPDEWELVRAECLCGLRFDDEDVWAHLDEVAAGSEADTDKLGEEPRDASLPAELIVWEPGGEPSYPIKATIFSQQDLGPETGPQVILTGHLLDRVMQAQTIEDVLDDLNERVRLPGDLEYDTVFYTVEQEGGEENSQGPPRHVNVRLPPSTVLADEIPEGKLLRVTNGEHAPYEFVDSPE